MSSRIRVRLPQVMSGLALALAVGIAGVFFYQAGSFESLLPEEPGQPEIPGGADDTTVITPDVGGFDKDKLPFEISAKRAVQNEAHPEIVTLEDVTGTFKRLSGQIIKAQADRAVYNSKLKILDLEGNVVLVLDGKVTAKLESARVNVEDKSLRAIVPVDVAFADGLISAHGFEITDDGRRVLFLNGVKSRFGGKPQGTGTP